MRYSVTFFEREFNVLSQHLAAKPGFEQAAYLICRAAITSSETRLIVRDVLPVEGTDILADSSHHIKIASRSFIRAMKKADRKKQCFLFLNSNPVEYPNHSVKEDLEEPKL